MVTASLAFVKWAAFGVLLFHFGSMACGHGASRPRLQAKFFLPRVCSGEIGIVGSEVGRRALRDVAMELAGALRN